MQVSKQMGHCCVSSSNALTSAIHTGLHTQPNHTRGWLGCWVADWLDSCWPECRFMGGGAVSSQQRSN